MAKKFNIHNWQAKHLFEQDEFTPDLEDDELKRSKIQQMMAKEKIPTGGDERLRKSIEPIATMYSLGEILDAIESFYIKNDEQKSAAMARTFASEFRDALEMQDEFNEANVTGTGASFNAGASDGYMTPNTFAKKGKWKNKKAVFSEQEKSEEPDSLSARVDTPSELGDKLKDIGKMLKKPKGVVGKDAQGNSDAIRGNEVELLDTIITAILKTAREDNAAPLLNKLIGVLPKQN